MKGRKRAASFFCFFFFRSRSLVYLFSLAITTFLFFFPLNSFERSLFFAARSLSLSSSSNLKRPCSRAWQGEGDSSPRKK